MRNLNFIILVWRQRCHRQVTRGSWGERCPNRGSRRRRGEKSSGDVRGVDRFGGVHGVSVVDGVGRGGGVGSGGGGLEPQKQSTGKM